MKTTNSTELPPIPPELAEYIEQAETDTLPDPLDDPNVKTVWVPSGRLSFINTVEQNGGKFSVFDALVLPGGGTPLHLHNLEAEWFYIIDGEADLQLDDNLIQSPSGTLKFSPIGELHSVKNNSDEPVRMLLFYEPDPDDPNAIGNIERFFSDPRVSSSFDLNNPDVSPTFNPSELVEASPEYGLDVPSTFIFTSQQYTDNEVSIVRTGEPDEAANVTLSLGNELDIPIYFGEGDMKKTIFLPSSLGEQTQDIILKDPSEGSYVGLTSNQSELSELDGQNGLIVTDIDDNNVLTGGNGDDFLSGLKGNDIIQGLSGRDLILGGSGDDLISGGKDSDTISGQDGDDNISGNDGDDSLNGNSGSDDILAGNGNDTINGGSESDRLLGEDGDDSILGGAAGDLILGGDGNDILAGNAGYDLIFGNSGDDRLSGGSGNDSLDGGSNNDLSIGIDPSNLSSNFGTGELDTLTGGANNDTFVLANENQVFYDDRDNFKAGDEDFALVTDFDSNLDTIQLQGEADFYSLDFFTSSTGTIDAKLIYDPGVSAVGETIAVLENVDSDLSIDNSAFTFV